MSRVYEWDVYDTGVNAAPVNMQLDAEWLQSLEGRSRPILHLYEWATPCATYGYFIDPAQYFDLGKVTEENFSLARRPTGGGIIFHLWDMAFSVLVPAKSPLFSLNTLENYAWVNASVLAAVQKTAFAMGCPLAEESWQLTEEDRPWEGALGRRFCMARPTKYDVIWGDKKVAGAAQRKTKEGFLHQGTISLSVPEASVLHRVLKEGSEKEGIIEAMQQNAYSLLPADASAAERERVKAYLKNALYETFLTCYSLVRSE